MAVPASPGVVGSKAAETAQAEPNTAVLVEDSPVKAGNATVSSCLVEGSPVKAGNAKVKKHPAELEKQISMLKQKMVQKRRSL